MGTWRSPQRTAQWRVFFFNGQCLIEKGLLVRPAMFRSVDEQRVKMRKSQWELNPRPPKKGHTQ